MQKKTIVVSAVNLVSGGTLTILRQCLEELSKRSEYRVVAIVHDKKLCEYENIEYIELPEIKKSWLRRVSFEYFELKKLSKQLNAYLWLSLHDMTPNVVAEHRVVYCHNSTLFFRLKFQDLKFDYKVVLFALFYKYLYRINIKKNDYVIVQQNWLRDEFSRIYKIDKSKIIVAYANSEQVSISEVVEKQKPVHKFFYPSFSRQFKNFEIVCQAVELLIRRDVFDFKVILTIDGTENSYARWVVDKYKYLENIDFVGLIPSNKMAECYENIDCLIFPSRLESWGLPISEFGIYGKPMLLADLPYAHETANGLSNICYFDPYNAFVLSEIMGQLINGDFSLCRKSSYSYLIESPFTKSWKELFSQILKHV